VYLPAVGNSGGILSIWCKSSASLIFSFTGDNFVGVCLDWGALRQRVFIVNVYSKCDIGGKRSLWENLVMSKAGFGQGAWCILGDFNAVLNCDERKVLTSLVVLPALLKPLNLANLFLIWM
jgi:hypothetical protein